MMKTGAYICLWWSLHNDENGGLIYVCGGRCMMMRTGVLYVFGVVVA